jgi:hypothetical protein
MTNQSAQRLLGNRQHGTLHGGLNLYIACYQGVRQRKGTGAHPSTAAIGFFSDAISLRSRSYSGNYVADKMMPDYIVGWRMSVHR